MKCNTVKNPCKICLQAVTKKTGLQCQGACRKWAHFKCLSYTPGKIQDIKAGIIKVTCPCPDCNTSEPKEVLADPPFTCTNSKCSANKLPVCESQQCPSKDTPIPVYPPPPLEYSPVSSEACSPRPPSPRTSSAKRCPNCPLQREPHECTPPPCTLPLPSRSSPLSLKHLPLDPQAAPISQTAGYTDPLQYLPKCKHICPPPCPSHQNMKKEKKCCSLKLSLSCSNLSNSANGSEIREISSESQISNTGKGVDQKTIYAAIENLCNTVGHLSSQLKELMCKMQESQ